MGELPAFLERESAAIIAGFANVRPRSPLRGHIDKLLGALAKAIREQVPPEVPPLGDAALDPEEMLGDISALRSITFDLLERAGINPTVREIRLYGELITSVVGGAVRSFTSSREALLDRQRTELLELFQQSPGFLAYVRGHELVYELENEAYHQIIGNRPVHGRSIREALPELAGQGYYELLEGVLDTGKPFIGRGLQAHLQRTPNAPLETVYVDLIFQPIRDASGNVVGVLMQGNDVTAVVREEAARRQAEERYRTLFESIDDGYCLVQIIEDEARRPVDYTFIEVNAAFENQTGMPNPVGKSVFTAMPGFDTIWIERYGAVAQTGVPFRVESHVEYLNRSLDIHASRVGDPAQKLVAVVFRDITARKEAEAERERLLALESAARQEAENASRLRDDFLATVSHELRTPLNAMLGWVQMLRVGTLDAAKQKHALETIERNARAQTQLIDDLLDVSRILAGKLRLEREPVDVKTVVEGACDAIQPAALAKEIRVECLTEPGLNTVGDAHRLQQIVGNLVSNAVKFTPRRGSVRVLAGVRDDAIRVEVTDSGQGIDAAFLPHVFERFRQANGTTTRKHGGLGLGLAIVRQLVELHGGSVAAASEGIGHGATFIVELPRTSSAREAGAVPRPTSSGTDLRTSRVLDGLDVLIVEDEPDTRDMLRAMTEMLGGRVRTAEDAAQAFASLEGNPPDVLLSDIAMPEEDGYSLIERVRQLAPERGGAVPAVAITAFSRTEDRTRALRAGFDSHVAKPVEASELTAVLEALLLRAGKTSRVR